MAIKRFFMGEDVKTRTKKIDAAEKQAVTGKPVPKPAPKKPVVKKPQR